MEWGTLVTVPAAALSNKRRNGSPRLLSTLCQDSGVLLVQGPKRLHNLIKFHAAAVRAVAKRRHSFDRAGVRRPTGEDRALFVQGKVGIIHDVFRPTVPFRWVHKTIEINGPVVTTTHAFLHGISPLSHSDWRLRFPDI